ALRRGAMLARWRWPLLLLSRRSPPLASWPCMATISQALEADAMEALDLIARELAKPMTHRVVTTYADGAIRSHETRGLAQAENYATGERRKIGRDLVDRATGATVRVVAVDIVPIEDGAEFIAIAD